MTSVGADSCVVCCSTRHFEGSRFTTNRPAFHNKPAGAQRSCGDSVGTSVYSSVQGAVWCSMEPGLEEEIAGMSLGPIAYNFHPRRSDRERSGTGDGSVSVVRPRPRTPVSPPSEPELLESMTVSEWDGVDVETENWRLEQFTWCRCTNCQPMPSVRECVCCHDLTEAEKKGVGDGILCLVEHEDFHANNINKTVLRSALLARVENLREALGDPILHRTYRMQAYRQCTYWLHERLGTHIRRVIPSCVVWAIRDAYPEKKREHYRGFLEADEVYDFIYEARR